MKGIKKIISLALACSLAFSVLVLPSSAADAATVTTMEQTLAALDIMNGDTSGDFHLSAVLTRAQLSKMLIQLSSTYRNTLSDGSVLSPYPDVPYTHWASGYVRTAVLAGYIAPYPDGTFRPNASVTGDSAVTALLGVLGYTADDYGTAHLSFAAGLGLLDETGVSGGTIITRQAALTLFYNALSCRAASGQSYISLLGYTVADGSSILGTVVEAGTIGPLVVQSGSWYAGTGLSADGATVYINEEPASLSDIMISDVVYYCPQINTVWAYQNRVVGVYQSVSPDRGNPASVTLSGMSYAIGSTLAAEALSSRGDLAYGDTIILLLGKNSEVAGVLGANDASVIVTGYATASGLHSYTSGSGTTTSAFYISIVQSDGAALSYDVVSDPEDFVGTIVDISIAGGSATVTRTGKKRLSGTVDFDSMTIGTYTMADDISFLDIYTDGDTAFIYNQRIDGAQLETSDVMHYTTNSEGQVTGVYLNSYTGDSFSYGIILTNVTAGSGNRCTYIIDGIKASYSGSALYSFSGTGPAALTFSGGQITYLKFLSAEQNATLTGSGYAVTAGGDKLLLSDKVSIYRYNESDTDRESPVLISLSTALSLDCTFTAYSETDQSQGGRVRILIAED